MFFYPLFFFCLASAAMSQPSIGLDAACGTLTSLLQISAEMAQPQFGVKPLCESLNADVESFFRADRNGVARNCYLHMINDYQQKLLKVKQVVDLRGKCGEAYWNAPATCSQACTADMAEVAAATLVPSPKCESMAKLMKCNLGHMCDLITTTIPTTTTTTTTNTPSDTTTPPLVCNRDTSGTCQLSPCHSWRGPTECVRTSGLEFQCLCLADYCATSNGTCVKPKVEKTCRKDTGASCQWTPCRFYLQAECKHGKCMCGLDDCTGGVLGLCESGLAPIAPPSYNDKCPANSTQAQKSPADFNSVTLVLTNCLDALPDVGDPVFLCVVFSMFLMLVVTAWTWRTLGQSTRVTYSEPLLHTSA